MAEANTEVEGGDYRDPQAVLYQHYQLDQRARGSTLGIGRRTSPSSGAGFSPRTPLQSGQFEKAAFSQSQTPPADTTSE